MALIIATAFGAMPLVAHALVYNEDTNYQAPVAAYGPGPNQTYASSSARPAAWNYVYQDPSTQTDLSPGYIFFGPRGTQVQQAGGVIYNQTGELIYAAAVDGYQQTMRFGVQTYQNKSVLTMWQGQFNAGGYGSGYNVILDSTYTNIKNVSTSGLGDVGADIHEFVITANDTALLTAYNATNYDLSAYNGTADGYILDCIVQEVDIASGNALFTWHSLDHVSPSLCYASPGTSGGSADAAWDYYHVNSIEKDNSGNYLISSRHCHAVYYVQGSTGDILWTLNGMNSSFTMGNGTTFEWQHDARFHGNTSRITIFDNAGTAFATDEVSARGLAIDLDMSSMTATLVTQLIPQNTTASQSQGNVQLQDNGNYMVGWGQTPNFGEYKNDGTPLWGAQFGVGDVQTYRVYRQEWVGYPTTLPSLAVSNNGSATTASCSWNGATEISMWQLWGSNDAQTATSLSNNTKMGFETNITAPSTSYAYYQVSAHEMSGAVLGYSQFVATNGSTAPPTSAESSSASQALASGTSAIGSATASGAAAATTAATAKSSGSSSSYGMSLVTFLAGVGLAGLAVIA